jgi:hypothetical protein
MNETTTNTTSSIHPTEYPLHPRFYQFLNIPPCPLSKGEMAYHLRNYVERIGALVTTEDRQEQYILVNRDISVLTGLNEGETFTLHEAGQERRTFSDFSRRVWRRVRLSR